MAKYLVDTNILIDHLRGKTEATKFLQENSPLISVVTVAELIQGCSSLLEQKQVNVLVFSLKVIELDQEISSNATKLMQKYYLSHHLGYLDALIASTAIKHGLTLVSENQKHFKFIKDLTSHRLD